MQPADLNLTSQVTGHQRFLFIRIPQGNADFELAQAIDDLGDGMENMHGVDGNASADSFRMGRFQFLRAEPSLSGERDIPHAGLSVADGLIRLEAETSEPLLKYEQALRGLVESRGGAVETLAGVQRPRSYTSYAMTQYAYEPALAPGPGERYPFGVVTPQNKTQEWWDMDWIHRESFFLPRYGANEELIAKGHSLAAEAGIASINRRLVHAPDGYGVEGNYDFVGYFEFAEHDARTFHDVMAGLRDVKQNPEWKYVKEGPEWWGRRVQSAREMLLRIAASP